MQLDPAACLPADFSDATLVGRVETKDGPCVVSIRPDGVYDLTAKAPTLSDLFNMADPVAIARAGGPKLGETDAIVKNSAADQRKPGLPWLLAPCDLAALKASGVTFVASLLERVVEEQARGDRAAADRLRQTLGEAIGADLSTVKPGSDSAMKLKEALIKRGAWSQYLEVGIGPDAEIFTKSQPMSAVGLGADIGVHPASTWNNPEPEIVLAVNAAGKTVGASLGNDVNLRDVEGRSGLLLGKAKDNNASCAIGPAVRLFDEKFSIDDVRQAHIDLTVVGDDGFKVAGGSSMSKISRDPLDLVGQTIGKHHQYPDGFMLYLGTMFAPTADRGEPGKGFTHHVGDVVTVSTPKLGALVNRVGHCDQVAPWVFGVGALMRNLAARGLILKP
ncbi:MAG: fumarylacetoacetate hydrolase family protein [Elsteraceae bacterium]